MLKIEIDKPTEVLEPGDYRMPEDFELPKYGDPGRMLFYLYEDDLAKHKMDVELIDYDVDASPFWLNEGGFPEYTILDWALDEKLAPGYYVVEDVVGHYYRGVYGLEEDDESWEHGQIRPATQEEIDGEALNERPQSDSTIP